MRNQITTKIFLATIVCLISLQSFAQICDDIFSNNKNSIIKGIGDNPMNPMANFEQFVSSTAAKKVLVINNPTNEDLNNLVKAFSLHGEKSIEHDGQSIPAPIGTTWTPGLNVNRMNKSRVVNPQPEAVGNLREVVYGNENSEPFKEQFIKMAEDLKYSPLFPGREFSTFDYAALNRELPDFLIDQEVIGYADPFMGTMFFFAGIVESVFTVVEGGHFAGAYLNVKTGSQNIIVEINEPSSRTSNIWYRK